MTTALHYKPTHIAVLKLKTVDVDFQEFTMTESIKKDIVSQILDVTYEIERCVTQGDAIEEDVLEEILVEEVYEYWEGKWPINSLTVDWPNSYIEVIDTNERLISDRK